jgi:hypothetical protein
MDSCGRGQATTSNFQFLQTAAEASQGLYSTDLLTESKRFSDRILDVSAMNILFSIFLHDS